MLAPKPTKAQIEAVAKVLNERMWAAFTMQQQINQFPPYQTYHTYHTGYQTGYQITAGSGGTGGYATSPNYAGNVTFNTPNQHIHQGLGTFSINSSTWHMTPALTVEELATLVLEAAAKAWWEGVARKMATEEVTDDQPEREADRSGSLETV